MPKQGKSSVEDRLHRIEGQIRGIERMLEREKETPQVLIQIQAVISSLESVKLELIKDNVRQSLEREVMNSFDLLK